MKKRDLSWLLSGYRRNIPWYLSVRMSRHTTGTKSAKHCLHWNVWIPCSPAKAGRMNSLLVSEETDKEQYTRAFGRFITPLQEKQFQKLVLSRSSARHIGDDFSPLGAFVRACNNYPRMMIYLCHTP